MRLWLLLWPCTATLLEPVAVDRPLVDVFPAPSATHHLPPSGVEVPGAKATNKFWANWAVEEGQGLPIHPMPYVLQFGSAPANLMVSRSAAPAVVYGDEFSNGADKIRYYFSPMINEFGLGALEEAAGPFIVKEGLFGVHVELRNGTRKMSFPIYSGMAYVSAYYTNLTPVITSTRAILAIERIQNGIWRLLNNGGKEFRLYALDSSGHFVGGAVDFVAGEMNQAFEGWLRLAEVQSANDTEVLDQHAQAVLVDWDLQVDYGAMSYSFRTEGSGELLHYAYAHHAKLLVQPQWASLTPMRAPTKGEMLGVSGQSWRLEIEMSRVAALDFLPPAMPGTSLAAEALAELEWFQFAERWRGAIFRSSYYFSGKGFQKIGSLCLLLEESYGTNHSHTVACVEILAKGFRCLYDPAEADCAGAPGGSYYESEWGGIASKEGFADSGCRTADFGNACYNDHHFHFGYFVVAGAILVHLRPEMAADPGFVSYVETLIRDTTNPSILDAYFPRFRSFDWFDLHSWSRGVVPSSDGKDQESTSEELNLLYGIQMWGRMTGRSKLEQLGSTMLALCILTVQEFFLMTTENVHHPADFVKNHVTGIFFQNKVDYATWFGWRFEYIHGIQMLPLTPALILTRTPEFCQQEWDNVLSKLALPESDPWTSIILTGTLAVIEPTQAFDLISSPSQTVDDGLTRVWAQRWALTARASFELLHSTTSSTSTRSTTSSSTASSSSTTTIISSTSTSGSSTSGSSSSGSSTSTTVVTGSATSTTVVTVSSTSSTIITASVTSTTATTDSTGSASSTSITKLTSSTTSPGSTPAAPGSTPASPGSTPAAPGSTASAASTTALTSQPPLAFPMASTGITSTSALRGTVPWELEPVSWVTAPPEGASWVTAPPEEFSGVRPWHFWVLGLLVFA